jgi:chemotaxis receptor (MCP) glutamine deamidase CheD
LQTLLGSCVAVCLHDPAGGVGGMNHILLPGTATGDRKTRFGVQAMEVLINSLMREGGDRRRFVAKAFGAANVLAALSSPTVGELNAKFVREFLAAERIPLVAHRLGGKRAMHVHFSTDTGKVIAGFVNVARLPHLIEAETTYNSIHQADEYYTGEVTLF